VSVVNSIGQLVKTISQSKSEVNVDISELGKGMYFILINVGGNFKNLKVIVE